MKDKTSFWSTVTIRIDHDTSDLLSGSNIIIDDSSTKCAERLLRPRPGLYTSLPPLPLSFFLSLSLTPYPYSLCPAPFVYTAPLRVVNVNASCVPLTS